eukprot:TRINITY_DN4111_c0_g1_i9.p1 TRINITY_DN4111_c0_g1~~TRINITY_DN4111_c0_g1_i9.p1  ORF type:complete len:369 (-),score=58.74 TRINITY_DN4111_c0_g1_i9:116-1222(-)
MHNAFGPVGTQALYSHRDSYKKIMCAGKGITLVVIPFWWDGKEESLAATLHLKLPNLFPKMDTPPIPTEAPSVPPVSAIRDQVNHEVQEFLMCGQEWNILEHGSPNGWWMSEKLDGVRAFWDGNNLFSRKGKVIPAPEDFILKLPTNVTLDGELWCGYDTFQKVVGIVTKSVRFMNNQVEFDQIWKDVEYCVFDAPGHPGHYRERHAHARDSLLSCDPRIRVIPTEKCLGLDHLQATLEHMVGKGGEGLMLYHPESPYVSGRTDKLLKVKAYKEEDVKFLKCNHNSYTFMCEQLNGVSCIVKCSGWDYRNPPPEGSVLTVKHMGYYKTSRKLKFPFMLRCRPDLSWSLLKHQFDQLQYPTPTRFAFGH